MGPQVGVEAQIGFRVLVMGSGGTILRSRGIKLGSRVFNLGSGDFEWGSGDFVLRYRDLTLTCRDLHALNWGLRTLGRHRKCTRGPVMLSCSLL